ncbi:hypothetical protein TRFO_06096 [Tritrichomonas foetus]|uniref:UBA domain-containing protein n=1 Tax=Tritrichomonas foetus TaxID=1144522 RepID=A0A1J4K129_9EUKA|nr:hypothetical protein TRFO_06096 [Tritrichomonas foetus]|eukprot:OHT05087.1 hypothetical protein TRFO_06096 [Tritrichomonas foetus]
MIDVPLSTVTGKEFSVQVSKDSNILQLKKIIEEKFHFQLSSIKLIYRASILPDSKYIRDINLENDKNSTIFIHATNMRAIRPKPGPLPSNSPPQNTEKPKKIPSQPPNSQQAPIKSTQPNSNPIPKNLPQNKTNPNNSINSSRHSTHQNLPNNNNPILENFWNPNSNRQTHRQNAESTRESHHHHHQSQNLIRDPPNFQELVGNLVDLGFQKVVCENSLRAANFDVNAAAALLLSSTSNEQNGQINQNSPSTSNQQNNIQRRTLQAELERLTPGERAVLKRLQRPGYDPEAILEIFLAADRNEQIAAEWISSGNF